MPNVCGRLRIRKFRSDKCEGEQKHKTLRKHKDDIRLEIVAARLGCRSLNAERVGWG